MENKKKIYITSQNLKRHRLAPPPPRRRRPILSLAGQDVTDAFIAFHPGSAWKHLDPFFTGFYLEDYKISDVSRDYRALVAKFVKSGLFDKKGHSVIYSLSFISLMFASCLYLILCCTSFWAHILAEAILGLAWMQVTYLGHDSGHYNIMITPGYNKLAQIMTENCLTGISMAWWKWTHNAHHMACNSLDHDPDLQHLPFLAVSSRLFQSITSQFYKRQLTFDSLSRFFVSYQHLTFYPVMVVARFNLYLQTILLLFFSKRKVQDRAINILGILVFYTWFPALLSYLPNWTERALFILASFTVCSVQLMQFCLNHFAANVYVGAPKGNDWFEKQTNGTIDIDCSTWMDWFFGGLQFQLEHHLFPRMPRCHLRSISPVVQELCKKHNLPYNSVSFVEANKWTLRTLRSAALEARDLSSPVAKNLIWEAVNTHG
ncbi:Delta 8 Fatty Acid Desaturase [Castilleja foliolosa]|uniref:Delta 8 Fatty Acid Desaturase n=1 Tax=Castilleja foliolosa TaxID=1961234 RepID=A0ABD3C4P2_9LAMI